MKKELLVVALMGVFALPEIASACMPDVTRQSTYNVLRYGRELTIQVQAHETASVQYTLPADARLELTLGKDDGVLEWAGLKENKNAEGKRSKTITFDLVKSGTQELRLKSGGQETLSYVNVEIAPQPKLRGGNCGWGR